MKIVFLSTYMNHHQKSLSDSFYKLINSDYLFIETKEISPSRKELGYPSDYVSSYLLRYDKNPESDINIINSIEKSDVIIWGYAPKSLLKICKKSNNYIFRYSERPLKDGNSWLKYLPRLIKWSIENPRKKSYLLSASAYAYWDYSKFFLFKNKSYKWGYFPEVKHYEIDYIISTKKKKHILWCGRLLKWKHPDEAILLANNLKSNNIDFFLSIIGAGELEAHIKELIHYYQLDDNVEFLGAMEPNRVRKYMEKAGIFIFTSDRREGWGAVLNESMNSGCSVVASHEIGSVPYLVENNKNGLIYKSGDSNSLYDKVKYLLENPSEQDRIGKEAYKTITTLWNADTAAERLVLLSQHIIKGERYPDLFKTGPCSKAEILKDNWFNEQ